MPVRKRKALVILYTGNGKGKTTAALGMLLRAWGRGMKVCMLSFIKTETSNYGEERAARKLGIELIPLGGGFTWLSKDLDKDRELAQRCWTLCKEKIASGEYDIVVLDEITYPITYGWLDVDEVIKTLRTRPADLHVVITGRDAHEKLVEFADLVTEMREVKHPFNAGIKAQPGVDF
ncbi:MAG TPA: cob(I)yrinic acid a,c-diamide adenosyltransferase [Dehalococcoidia bacterium]|jgi:cob(I)alamin adenosyltransferase|nr:cob(I)yrinic acid a,c-diamide adenosyltransferase [Dehalococcoidia bacterium]